MHYQITAKSMWRRPEVYVVDTESEKDELVLALRQEQYLVEVEEMEWPCKDLCGAY